MHDFNNLRRKEGLNVPMTVEHEQTSHFGKLPVAGIVYVADIIERKPKFLLHEVLQVYRIILFSYARRRTSARSDNLCRKKKICTLFLNFWMEIITDDEEGLLDSDRGPITITPIWKWLLLDCVK